jgi:formylglycine-generating enzyme required for sulfatase activity
LVLVDFGAAKQATKTIPGKTVVDRERRSDDFGVYDMHGNMEKWCADSWHPNYIDAPTNSIAWFSSNSNERVVRGGRGGRGVTIIFNRSMVCSLVNILI